MLSPPVTLRAGVESALAFSEVDVVHSDRDPGAGKPPTRIRSRIHVTADRKIVDWADRTRLLDVLAP